MKTETYTVVEMDKEEVVINYYRTFIDLNNARQYKKRKIKHLTESGLIEGTVVILDSKNKIVN